MTEWTEGRLRSFIISALRSATRRYPPKYEAKNEAKTIKKINPASGKLAQHYRCAMCKEEFTSTNVEVDHIESCVDPAVGFVSWDEYIKRMFCDKDNFQILCTTCHSEKTKLEKESKKNANSSTSVKRGRKPKV